MVELLLSALQGLPIAQLIGAAVGGYIGVRRALPAMEKRLGAQLDSKLEPLRADLERVKRRVGVEATNPNLSVAPAEGA